MFQARRRGRRLFSGRLLLSFLWRGGGMGGWIDVSAGAAVAGT